MEGDTAGRGLVGLRFERGSGLVVDTVVGIAVASVAVASGVVFVVEVAEAGRLGCFERACSAVKLARRLRRGPGSRRGS